MPDDADLASKTIEDTEEDMMAQIRHAVSKIPAGEPGTCRECEQPFARIVDGLCARCRDANAGRRRAWAA